MIQVTDISKSYGPNPVLKGLSLNLEEGDFLVLLGASGSGKSTLLNIMSGLEIPDSGAVYYDQINLADLSEAERTAFRKDQVGFIFQQYYLLPQLTVEQNIKVGAYLAGNQDFEDLIQALGLEEIRYHYPASLSGGQQQRVAIARALAKKPRVLFLDEPTGALDEATGRQILGYISQLQSQTGVTLVMVTHNEHIAQMANRVVRMNSGQIQSITYNETRLSADEIGW